MCILANETDAAAVTAGRDRPILYGPYHEEALIAVHQAGVTEENERINTQIKMAIADRVSQGSSLDPLDESEIEDLRRKVKAADQIVKHLRMCTIIIGAVWLADLVHAYERIGPPGGSHG